jgi:DNA-binding NtrC family response regulator
MSGSTPFLGIIGRSRAHQEILQQVERVARFDAEVLITGPTGTGKEVYARHLHARGPRSAKAFVAVNCGALPGDLFENEMFGHVGGAFTGARALSVGLVAAAEGGTLFMDEVDALPPPAQAKLLRFVQFREYRRLGDARVRSADVRIVSASNADLGVAVRQGLFREDLLFRLKVIPIHVPPLRERRDDIPEFFQTFGVTYAHHYGVEPIRFSSQAWQALTLHDWPGNVREVENCVRYLTCLQLRRSVEPDDLPFRSVPREVNELGHDLANIPMKQAKRDLIRRFERRYLEDALRQSNGNITHAARASGKDRRAFFELLRRHGLQAAKALDGAPVSGDPDAAVAGRRAAADQRTKTRRAEVG